LAVAAFGTIQENRYDVAFSCRYYWFCHSIFLLLKSCEDCRGASLGLSTAGPARP